MADEDSFVGPALPPSMSRASTGYDQIESSRTEDVTIGPALPPHLIQTQNKSADSSDKASYIPLSEEGQNQQGEIGGTMSRDDNVLGSLEPKLPPRMISNPIEDSPKRPVTSRTIMTMDTSSEGSANVGPSLPPNVLRNEDQENSESDEDAYGPALPPGFVSGSGEVTESEVGNIGPALPPGFKRTVTSDDESGDHGSDEELDNESSEDEFVGPLPASAGGAAHRQSATDELEARAAAMKKKLTTKDESVAPSRDSWMTELPEFSKDFGLGPRTFRKHARPDERDRSGWTDTPSDRSRKQQERIEKAAAEKQSSSSKDKKKKKRREEKRLSEKDQRLANEVARHNETARPDSLMDMHTKSRKRKLEEKGLTKEERRPFDRDTDLQVNRFDEARRKQLLKKSAHLTDKFAHSSEKMYL